MFRMLMVAIGGAVGAVLRYKLGGLVLHHTTAWKFPLSTFVVNIVGCLAIGILGGLAEKHHLLSRELELLLITGLLGGFTTFSAFGLETVWCLRRGLWQIAIANAMLSVLCGVGAVWLGMIIAGASKS